MTWASSSPSTAGISAAGLALSAQEGTTSITASLGAVSGSADLTVTQAALVRIGVTPADPTIAKGLTQQFTATGTFTDNTTQNLTAAVAWASSASNVAGIDGTGLATALATGASTITAALSGITGQTTISVGAATLTSIAVTPINSSTPLGTLVTFAATGTYTDGSTQNLSASVTWTSSATAVAVIDAAGVATATSLGTTTILAASGAISGSTDLTVTPATLVSVAVTPAIPSLALGRTQQFTATGTYTDATVQDITDSVTWSSSDAGVATVSMTVGTRGLATSHAVGTTTISASSNGVSGQTTLTVTAAVITLIEVTPASPSLPKGTSQAMTATATYSDSTNADVTTSVAWSSSDTNVASVSPAGSVGAVNVGTGTITAAKDGVIGSTTVQVTAATLTSIGVAPVSASIPLGTTQQFTATGGYTDGTTQNLTGAVHWSSSDGATATISNAAESAGLATSVGVGGVTVTATLGAVSGTASLNVTPAELVSIAVTPLAPAIPLGRSQQFTATGSYTDLTQKDITTTVTWSTSDATVAIVSNTAGSNGLATSSGIGTATIAATYGAISNSTTLTVGAPEIVSIAVTPASATRSVGETQAFTATATYTDGSTGDVTASATWSTSSSSTATIDAAGLATAVSTGTVTVKATSGSIQGTASFTVVALPSISSFTASPATITTGGSSQLSATFTGGTAVITPGNIAINSGGSVSVSPSSVGTTTYTLTVTNAAGTATTQTTTVVVAPAPFISSFTASPTSITAGNSSTLTAMFGNGRVSSTRANHGHYRRWGVRVADRDYDLHFDRNEPGGDLHEQLARRHRRGGAGHHQLHRLSGGGEAGKPERADGCVHGRNGFDRQRRRRSHERGVENGYPHAQHGVHADRDERAGGFRDGDGLRHGFPAGVDLDRPDDRHDSHRFAGALLGDGDPQRQLDREPDEPRRVVVVGCSGGDVNAVGLVTGTAAGTATITATLGAISGSATVTVTSVSSTAGRFVYAANQGGSVSGYILDQTTGALTAVPGSPVSTSYPGYSVASHPSGRFVYVGNYYGLTGFSSNATTGQLTLIPGGNPFFGSAISSFAFGPVYAVAADPAGRFVYAVNYNTSEIQAYQVDGGNGALSQVGTYLTGQCSRSLIVEASGKFVYLTNECGTSGVWAYAIDANTGELTMVPGSPFGGGSATSVTAAPNGQVLYAISSNQIRGYTINSTTGALTLLSGFPVTTPACCTSYSGLTVDPAGRYLYAVATGGSISAYRIDAVTGGITAVAGSPFVTGATNTFSASIDASGKFLYVSSYAGTSNNPGAVIALAINQATGALTAAPGSPFPSASVTTGVTTTGAIVGSVATLDSIEIGPAAPTILTPAAGTKLQLRLLGHYSDGTAQFLTESASWSLSPAGIATISNAAGTKGLVTSTAFGQTTITATHSGLTTTATLTVQQPTPVSIAVTPASPTIASGTAIQFTAVATYSDNSTQTITASATWSSSDTNVATVSNVAGSRGLTTAVAAGSSTITATFNGVSGSTVLAATMASPTAGRFVYAASLNSNTISGFAVDQVREG